MNSLCLQQRYRHGFDVPKSDALATTIFGVLADGVRVASAVSGKSAFRATRIDRPEDIQLREQDSVQVNRLEAELEVCVCVCVSERASERSERGGPSGRAY